MNRRQMILRTTAATVGLGLAGCAAMNSNAQPRTKKVLFFTKSSNYEHAVIKRTDGKPSFAENILADLGPKHGIEFTFSKDGSLFSPEYLAQFDALFFYTTGDLTTSGTDKQPPMSPAGKTAFLDAIKNGKGFIGMHSASDTFHTHEPGGFDTRNRTGRYQAYGDEADPYVRMLGAEFIIHGEQQVGKMQVADGAFPGLKGAGTDFAFKEEWYSMKDFSKDLHVILVQDTAGMTGKPYQRPSYPATWARMHGKGRVFYTSMGHREDVWTNPVFQDIVFGGIAWAVRDVNADIAPNLDKAAPGAGTFPPQ